MQSTIHIIRQPGAAPRSLLSRLARRLCFPFTQRHWAHRLLGGKWELWWADPCNDYVWLDVDDWTPKGKRPGGCAIWEQEPAPLAREDYSSPNTEICNEPENGES